MILGFHKTNKSKILDGSKIHTIREDKYNRWKPGMKIHFATSVRTKSYEQFKEGVCVSTQKIIIKYKPEKLGNNFRTVRYQIYVNGKLLFPGTALILAMNDGFKDVDAFLYFFQKDILSKKTFTGKIIHWTDFKY